MATTLLAGCAPAMQSPAPSSSPEAQSALAAHLTPVGATASVDAASWALVDRLVAPSYTADTTTALVEGLARSGIGTYDDPASAGPALALTVPPSPFRLLSFQAHALAVGAWAGSDFGGAELDAVAPLPPELTGVPTTSELLAAYVATADSPGGNLSRALMAGQDLLVPTKLQFPAVVLVLFASDLATDGGRLAVPAPSLSAAAEGSVPLAGLAIGLDPGRTRIELAVATGICSDTANWINGAIASIANALKVATAPGGVHRLIAGIWNWLVDVGQAFVQGLLSAVTDAVLGPIRSIAATIAGVVEQIASLLPQAVAVRASGTTGGGTFNLGPDPLTGTFTVTVTAGDLPDWPAVLSDCAKTAGVALPDFHGKSVPLTWGPLEAPANPLLSTTGSNPMTDANGLANWGFVTSVDPGDPKGQQRNQIDYLPVAVHRPELDAARQRLSNVLLGSIPDLLRPYVAAIFAPYLDGLQSRLNALLDAHGRGAAVIVFHDQAPSPPPSSPQSPAPSGSCSPSPVAAGSYTGTYLYSLSLPDNVMQANGSGMARLSVASDGTITGAFGATIHQVEPGLLEGTYTISNGLIGGTACDLVPSGGTVAVVNCHFVIGDDCSSAMAATGPPLPVHMGSPVAGKNGSFTWEWKVDEPTAQGTIRIAVSRQ